MQQLSENKAPAGDIIRTEINGPVNILLVDDHPENLIALQAILEHPDYRLVAVGSGVEALRELLHHEFAVILLDVMMPDMDGFELAECIKQRESSRNTPIIFLTAVAMDIGFIYRGYRVGAVDYLAKPLDPEIVRAKVAVFVELFRKEKRLNQQAAMLRESEMRERDHQISEIKRLSEKRYRDLADAIPQMVWTCNAEGEPNYFNHKWFTYTGADFVCSGGWQQYADLFHPLDFATFERSWQNATKNNRPFEVECRLRCAENSAYSWHLCRALPELDNRNVICGWLGTFTDISDQKRNEMEQWFLAQIGEVLISSRHCPEAALEIVRLAIATMADWCVIDLFDEYHGDLTLALHGDDRKSGLIDELKERFQGISLGVNIAARSAKTEIVVDVDEEWLSRNAYDGEQVKLLKKLGTKSILSAPIQSGEVKFGTITFVYGDSCRSYDESQTQLMTELGRRMGLAFENTKLYLAARETNRLKDEFLATMSHELRTPLNAVIGWSDLLLSSLQDDSIRQGIEVIRRNGLSLATLVDDLLDLSRVISGNLELTIIDVDVAKAIQSSLESLRPALDAKLIQLDLNLPTHPVFVSGDMHRLQQIISNLLSNAIKFTPATGTITIDLQALDGEVVLAIKDTGIGISAEFLPYIFQRFRQADSSTTRRFGGLGLGLAIVKHLVDLHKGKISVESAGVNQGSIFTITFAEKMTSDQDQAVLGEAPTMVAPSAKVLNGLKIAVVDDEADARDLVQRILTGYGAKVRAMGSVPEALKEINHDHFDLVLSDIGMPHEDGFSLIKAVRRSGNPVPVAAITAYASKTERQRILDAGFNAHLSKPFKSTQLISLIGELANRKEYFAVSSSS